MINAIRQMPSGELENIAIHDPFSLQCLWKAYQDKALASMLRRRIVIDLRDNIDCVEAGLNQSRACAMSNAVIGVFILLDPTIPHNAGGFQDHDPAAWRIAWSAFPSPLPVQSLRPTLATGWGMQPKPF